MFEAIESKLQALASTLAGPSWQTVPPYWSIRHRLSLLTVFLRFSPSPYCLDGQKSQRRLGFTTLILSKVA